MAYLELQGEKERRVESKWQKILSLGNWFHFGQTKQKKLKSSWSDIYYFPAAAGGEELDTIIINNSTDAIKFPTKRIYRLSPSSLPFLSSLPLSLSLSYARSTSTSLSLDLDTFNDIVKSNPYFSSSDIYGQDLGGFFCFLISFHIKWVLVQELEGWDST